MVIEVKSEAKHEKNAVDQLVTRGDKGGYLLKGHFDEGFVAGPNFRGKRHTYGVITNTEDGQLQVIPYRKEPSSSSEAKQMALRQVERLVKLVLANNLSMGRLLGVWKENPLNISSFRMFLKKCSEAVECLTLDEMRSLVEKEKSARCARQSASRGCT